MNDYLNRRCVEVEHLHRQLFGIKALRVTVAVVYHLGAQVLVGEDALNGFGECRGIIGRHIEAGGATGFFKA